MSYTKNPFIFSKKQEAIIISNCYLSTFVMNKNKEILTSRHCAIQQNQVLFYEINKEYHSSELVTQMMYIYPN